MTAFVEVSPLERSFVPKDLVVDSAAVLEPLYGALLEMPVDTVDELSAWLHRWSELSRVVDEERTRRSVASSCDTLSKDVTERHLDFIRDITPKVDVWESKMRLRYYESAARSSFRKEHTQLDRIITNQVELFRDENVPLYVQLMEITHHYDELAGSLEVTFEGKTYTLPQMAEFSHDPNRERRIAANYAVFSKRHEHAETFEGFFDEMFAIRKKIAANIGLPSYREVCFREKLRDYTPEDCAVFHDAIEKTATPLLRKIRERRRKELGLEKLSICDAVVDTKGRQPLRPFSDTGVLQKEGSALFHDIDERLGVRFDTFAKHMDIDSRKGKAPGAYQATFHEQRHPFIFGNMIGLQRDLSTFVHESGHAIHAVQAAAQDLIWLEDAAMEFCEVSSMTHELTLLDHLDRFYPNKEDRDRAALEQWEDAVSIFCWVAVVDRFQHWLYTHPNHTREQRRQEFVVLYERYMPEIDWSLLPEAALEKLWHRQLHIFHVPFYYIEYAIAQLGSLQVYANYRKDPQDAVGQLLEAQSLGGSVNAPTLFETSGCRFDLGPELLGELMRMVEREIDALS